jgi:hypothetical protein
MSANPRADRVVRSWLHEDRHEDATRVLDSVLDEVDTTPQRRSGGTAWRFLSMNNNIVRVGLAAAAVVVIAIIAINLLPGSPAPAGEPTDTPTASPTSVAGTLASGSFTASLGEFGEAFDIDATGTGDDVSGTLDVSFRSGADGAYSVDLQCARTTDDGFLLIGGQVTESTYEEFIAEGAYVVIALAPGTPVRMLWAVDVLATDEVPAPAESCSAYIETLLGDPESIFVAVDVDGRPIEGDLQLGQ